MLGFRKLGQRHTENLGSDIDEAKFAAGADSEGTRAAKTAQGLEVECSNTSLTDAIEQKNVNAAVIADLAKSHPETTEVTASTDARTFAEKRLALMLEEACVGRTTVQNSLVQLQAGFVRRCEMCYAIAKQGMMVNGFPAAVTTTPMMGFFTMKDSTVEVGLVMLVGSQKPAKGVYPLAIPLGQHCSPSSSKGVSRRRGIAELSGERGGDYADD